MGTDFEIITGPNMMPSNPMDTRRIVPTTTDSVTYVAACCNTCMGTALDQYGNELEPCPECGLYRSELFTDTETT